MTLLAADQCRPGDTSPVSELRVRRRR